VALFARDNELRSVYDLVARSGTGGALVLRGEAGVGKTALLNEIISASRRADIRVLSTAGVSLQMQQPFAVPAPGAPLFQAANANLNPLTEDKVDTRNPDRGPLLIISGAKDDTVPTAISAAEYKKQQHNPGVTEFTEIPGRGHALTIDDG
jgi:pimeloyl-ACP methyl ester carboxylesterase